ncbi:hypothetical protein HPB50_020268 [Hyalomma asiaticum]|uniref:Uncharacterized protein n=1 Tax=Hyalomma asiaticum TaxID=266040 RepID=A0ACB7RQZ9_HYAAI|nr:hypothetical protein HPB50_020268 [Hyalomma asiaticum]
MDPQERTLYMATFGVVAAGLMLLRLRRKRQERRMRALQQRNRRLVALLAARKSPSPEPKSPRRTGPGLGGRGGIAGVGGRRRRVWTRVRSDNFWLHVISPDFSAQDWLHNFHLSRATFEHACELLRDHIATHDTAWRPATPVEKKVAVFLWRLSNNCHYKVLSQLFGVGRSSACLILKEAIQAVILHIMPRVIKPCENTTSFFEEVYGLPGCHGVLCSTYIPVSPPNYVKAEYAVPGQADVYACLLQVVVGRDGQITAARAGQTPSRPGRLEDWAFVPELTAPEQDAPSSSADSRTPGSFAYLVADSSFPLRPEVLKPYDFAATKPQRTYNSALNGAIGYATQTVLKLKARWKCLVAKYEGDLSSVGDLVLACCVLHNICEAKGDRFDPRWAENLTATHPASCQLAMVSDELLNKARIKRDALAIKLATRDV